MATSVLVPGKYHVGLNGRVYQVADGTEVFLRRRSVPFLRNQADTADTPGSSSISPEGAWRRGAEDWSHGAGQTNYDREDSDPARFRASKGIDPWTRWQLTLQPETALKRSSAASAMRLVVSGDHLYVSDGTALLWTTDITVASPTFTNANIQAGEAAVTVNSLATDGYTVYAGLGANGIHSTARGASTSTHYNDQAVDGIAWVKGRLMAFGGRSLFNITAAGAAPSPLFTHASTQYVWSGFAGGRRAIYASGYTGVHGEVWRIRIKADGTGLDTPVIAAELPDGEYPQTIFSYLGYVMIGTTLGVRFCVPDDATGDLILGSLIPTPGHVWCFEGQDRFVWFGWTNYDGTSTGLGRLDLSVFTAPLTPAYASDLMAAGQGLVRALATFQSRRVFTVDGLGVYAQQTAKVATGTLDSGRITYGITDTKVAMALDVRHLALVGSHTGHVAIDGGTFTSVGSHSTQGESASSPFVLSELAGESFEVRTELARLNSTDTTGPTVTRISLSSFPTPSRSSEVMEMALLLYEREMTDNGTETRDAKAELDALIALEEAGTVIDFQMGGATYRALIEDHDWVAEKRNDDDWWDGVLRLKVRIVA